MWARVALLSVLAGPAWGLGPDLADMVRDGDRARLAQLDAVAGHALLDALALGAAADRDILLQALSGAAITPTEALAGDWSCRVMKLGGGLPLVVYADFRCRIGADGTFEKLTGSQRMLGTIGLLEGQPVYLGTGYIAGDTPTPYADLPGDTDPAAMPQRVPEVGLVQMVSPARARILLPSPVLESDLNVLWLTR